MRLRSALVCRLAARGMSSVNHCSVASNCVAMLAPKVEKNWFERQRMRQPIKSWRWKKRCRTKLSRWLSTCQSHYTRLLRPPTVRHPHEPRLQPCWQHWNEMRLSLNHQVHELSLVTGMSSGLVALWVISCTPEADRVKGPLIIFSAVHFKDLVIW